MNDSQPHAVTNAEVAVALARAFDNGPLERLDVIEAAIRSRARAAVVIALIPIPDRRYADIGEVLPYLEPRKGPGVAAVVIASQCSRHTITKSVGNPDGDHS